MIRLFNVYYPTRTLVLLLCEVLLVGGSFLLATAYLAGPDTYIVLILRKRHSEDRRHHRSHLASHLLLRSL